MAKGKQNLIVDGFKVCKGCWKKKPVKDFYPDPKSPYGVRSPCKECCQKSSKARYDEQKSLGKKHNQDRLDRRRAIKQELVNSLGGCCSQCGYNKSLAALEFHHPDGSKDYQVSEMLLDATGKNGKFLRAVQEEAAKCIILCANCHREFHDKTLAPTQLQP